MAAERRVRLVFTDVDGVLTDGGMYYGPDGEVMKRFDARDGMGVARLRDAGIETVIVTQESTDIVRARAAKLRIARCLMGIVDKAAAVREICHELGIALAESAYIGDDVNDLAAMRLVGISAAPSDAQAAVRSVASLVCTRAGGHAAFREFAEHLLRENTGGNRHQD